MTKWDTRFLELAEHVAQWSKDPSTQLGAVITDHHNRIVSLGYNGFPRGVNDDTKRYDDRETKYKMTVHAETNAVLFAQRNLEGCTMYVWPFGPCTRCASLLIQTGITRVIAPQLPSNLIERWAYELETSRIMFREAGVTLVEV